MECAPHCNPALVAVTERQSMFLRQALAQTGPLWASLVEPSEPLCAECLEAAQAAAEAAAASLEASE